MNPRSGSHTIYDFVLVISWWVVSNQYIWHSPCEIRIHSASEMDVIPSSGRFIWTICFVQCARRYKVETINLLTFGITHVYFDLYLLDKIGTATLRMQCICNVLDLNNFHTILTGQGGGIAPSPLYLCIILGHGMTIDPPTHA